MWPINLALSIMTTPQTQMRPLKSGTLKFRTVEALKQAILTGRFMPGEAIRELHAAAELGVSQNTIREALIELEQLGLVVRRPNRDTTVAKLSPRDVEERVSMRLLLEPKCLCLAARRLTPEHYNHLRSIIGEMRDTLASHSLFEVCQQDLRFHSYLWANSGHRIMAHVLEQVTMPLLSFVGILYTQGDNGQELVQAEHEQLLDALSTQDNHLIEAVVRTHVMNAYRGLLAPAAELL